MILSARLSRYFDDENSPKTYPWTFLNSKAEIASEESEVRWFQDRENDHISSNTVILILNFNSLKFI